MNRDLIICLLATDRHDRDAFDCGEPALNEYLQKTAAQHLKKGIANTYVLINSTESKRILGFFTLSFLEVDLSEVPAIYGKTLPKSHLPAVKLAWLAIGKSCQGKNYGRLLLVDAMHRVAAAIRNTAGVVGLFIDAKNRNVVTFYEKYGFIPLRDNPLSVMIPHQTILGLFSVKKSYM
jgi:GNAT superfamily N-acetyltransferase